MWCLIGAGILFCAFQFQLVNTSLSISIKIMICIGFLIIFWLIRKALLWKATEDERNESLRLLEEYNNKFNRGNNVRDVAGNFGESFGEGYSQMASASGDILHTIIGEGISLASKVLVGASKSKSQIKMENKLQMLSNRIDAKEKIATRSLIFVVVATGVIAWMSVQGMIPIKL